MVGRAWVVVVVVVAVMTVGRAHAGEADEAALEQKDRVFARIGGEKIKQSEFRQFVQFDASRRYYHGKRAVDSSQQAAWTQEFIDRVLLLQEAARRGITTTPARVSAWLDQVETRGRESIDSVSLARFKKPERERWASNELLLDALRQDVARRVNPTAAQVRQYYEQHAEKFTTPEQLGISMILLEVPPYASTPSWNEAQERARDLLRDLTQGAPFETLAQAHSSHESSRQGGNLGLVHVGMLSRELQAIAATLQPGQISPPQLVLQGVVIMRINERIPPRLNPFDTVSTRARELLVRELGEVAWRDLIRRLRESVAVELQHDQVS